MVLVPVRSALLTSGVVSLPLLLPGVGSAPFAPLSAMLAVLEICVVPPGTEAATVTANVAFWGPLPPTREPMASVQVEPALLFGAHTQPAVLAPALNVVLAGTVSV